MVNDSKLLLMYFVWVIYSPTKLFYASPTEAGKFADATNHTTIIMKKWEIRKKLLLAKIRTAQRSCWVN